MKKLFLALIFTILVTFTVRSQITTSMWGLNLGVTTMSEAEKIINKKGYALNRIGNKLQILINPDGPIRFGGHNWSSLFLTFEEGHLAEISFSKSAQISPSPEFAQLKKSLEGKYGQYNIHAESPNLNIKSLDNYTLYYGYEQFFDGKTLVTLSEFAPSNQYRDINLNTISLTYSNHALKTKARSKNGDNEL